MQVLMFPCHDWELCRIGYEQSDHSLVSVLSGLQFESQRLVLLEAGCGVGNCIFPLLEDDLNIFVYACDFSPRAVEFVKVSQLIEKYVIHVD